MRGRRRTVAGGMFAAAVAFAHTATAEGIESSPPVDVVVAGAPDALPRLERAVGVAGRAIHWQWVGAFVATDVVRRPSGASEHAARAWIDCSRADRVRVYFADWNTERFLLRDLPLPEGWNEIALEALGQILESSLSALDASDKTGMSRAEMASALGEKPPPPPPPPAPAAWHPTVGAFYGVQAFSSAQAVEQGPGLLGVLAQVAGPWRWGGWLSAQYRLPETVETSVIGVRLDTLSLRAGARLSRTVARGVELALHVGPGADIVHVAPRQGPDASASLSDDRFSVAYTAEVALACAARVGSAFAVWGALFADLDLAERRYEVIVDGATERVLTAFVVRPGVLAGVWWP